MPLKLSEVNTEKEYLSQFLSDRQKKHLFEHGYERLVDGRYILFLDAQKSRSIPIVRTKKKTKSERVKAAFRKAINPQIKQFRRHNNALLKKGFHCPITHLRITNWKQAHVDHIYPFISLLADFCLENKLSLGVVELNKKGEIKDDSLLAAWREFHQLNARLGILSKEANLKKAALTPDKIRSDVRYADLVPSLEFNKQ